MATILKIINVLFVYLLDNQPSKEILWLYHGG